MKKKLFALLCALLLLLQPVGALAVGESVYFVAVNENVLPLTDQPMPFWYSGYLYLHYSVFDNRKDLGIEYNHSRDKQTVVMYKGRGTPIIFDLQNGMTYDNQGNYFPESAIVRNGQVFLPAGRVAEYFGLIYTSHKVEYGYLIRLKTSGAVLSDSLLLDAASGRMRYLYSLYQQSLVQPPAEVITPVGPVVEQPTEENYNLYLSFLAGDTEQTTMWLDALDSRKACFYFPPLLLESAGDLSRRMVGTGQAIGLYVDASAGAEDALEQLTAGNRFLSRNTGTKSRLAYLAGATAQTVAAVEAAGWRVLTPRVDGSAKGLRKSGDAAALVKRFSNWKNGSNLTVWLGSAVEYAGLRALLTQTEETGDRFFAMTEQLG